MKTIKEIALSAKARKGPAHKITAAGAYWLAVEVAIARRGGDGIGNSGADTTDYFTVRHYRDNTLRAYCESRSWHQNYGSSTSRVRCDDTLDCETVEDLFAAIQAVPFDRESYDGGKYSVRSYQHDEAAAYFTERGLLAALPSPDEEPAPAPVS